MSNLAEQFAALMLKEMKEEGAATLWIGPCDDLTTVCVDGDIDLVKLADIVLKRDPR